MYFVFDLGYFFFIPAADPVEVKGEAQFELPPEQHFGSASGVETNLVNVIIFQIFLSFPESISGYAHRYAHHKQTFQSIR